MANGPNVARGDLDRMVKAYLESVTTDLLPARQPDTLLGGQPAYFLMGPVDKDRFTFVYGAVYGSDRCAAHHRSGPHHARRPAAGHRGLGAGQLRVALTRTVLLSHPNALPDYLNRATI